MAPLSSRGRLAGALGLALLVAACGGPLEAPPGSVSSAIVGGEVDVVHRNVFGIFVQKGNYASSCTATLLAPNVLLTARHCVATGIKSSEVICGESLFGESYPAEDMFATNDVEWTRDSNWFQGTSVHVPSEGDDTCGYDIALIILDRNVPAALAEPAVPRIDREVASGESYVAVGYGVNDSGDAGGRRVRSDLQVACDPGACGFGVRVSEFVGETGVCEGDSGGPAFDEQGKVVGVVSRGASDCSSPVYGTVTAWRDLITRVTLEGATQGGYEPPFWATSGVSDPPPPPEPVNPTEGQACGGALACAEGLICHRSADGDSATCTATCQSSSECPGVTSCQYADPGAGASEKICLELGPTEEQELADSGCAVAGGSLPSASGFGAGAVLAGWLLWRRRHGAKVA